MVQRFIFSILFLLSWSFCLSGAESFNNNLLYLLDRNDNTYFFRGNIPLRDGKFCYEELKDQIQNYLLEYGRPISTDFKLICISLLNNFADRKECMIESKWFSCHPDKGCIWRYPLFGYCCSPFYIPQNLRKVFYFTDTDGVRYLVRYLKKLVDFDYGEDVVIYMHCYAGKDRTGEASACYLMQYKGYSYSSTMSLNQQIARRKLQLMSINAIRWYAYYLREVCHLTSIGKIY